MKGSEKCAPKAERIYTPTYKQPLVNCLRKDENLLIMRDFVNATLNQGLVSAIENEMAIETVSEGIALEIKKKLHDRKLKRSLGKMKQTLPARTPTTPLGWTVTCLNNSPSKPPGQPSST